MYLLLPALFLVARFANRKAVIYICAIWMVAVLFTLTLWKLGLNYHLVKYLPCFIPGVIAFAFRKSEKRFGAASLFLYTGGAAVLFPIAVAMGAKENVLAWPLCLALGLLIPRCSEISTPWLSAFGKQIARYSYGIYLVHGPIVEFAFSSAAAPPFQWLVFLGGTTILSFVAYHLVEKPFIDFGGSLAHCLFKPSKLAHS